MHTVVLTLTTLHAFHREEYMHEESYNLLLLCSVVNMSITGTTGFSNQSAESADWVM